MTEKLLDRVGALLAKAESTDSSHEAEALVAKAQELATLHSVDLAMARQRTQRRHRREQLEQRKQIIGKRGQIGLRHRVALFVAIGHVNDLCVDVARDATYVLSFGFPSDLDVVETLHGSLATQMTAAANDAIKRGEHKEHPYWSDAAMAWRTDARVYRSAFSDGFIETIGERLRAARAMTLATRRPNGRSEHSTGAELVLVAKAEEVAAFHRATSDARGTWSAGGRSGSPWSEGAHDAGRDAAREARLAASREISGARGDLTA